MSLEFSAKRNQSPDINRGDFEDIGALHSHALELCPHGTEEAGKSRLSDDTELRTTQNVENVSVRAERGERGGGVGRRHSKENLRGQKDEF